MNTRCTKLAGCNRSGVHCHTLAAALYQDLQMSSRTVTACTRWVVPAACALTLCAAAANANACPGSKQSPGAAGGANVAYCGAPAPLHAPKCAFSHRSTEGFCSIIVLWSKTRISAPAPKGVLRRVLHGFLHGAFCSSLGLRAATEAAQWRAEAAFGYRMLRLL